MEEYISADPCRFDHHSMFKYLQTLTLDFRLNDPYCSLVYDHDLSHVTITPSVVTFLDNLLSIGLV